MGLEPPRASCERGAGAHAPPLTGFHTRYGSESRDLDYYGRNLILQDSMAGGPSHPDLDIAHQLEAITDTALFITSPQQA